MHVPGVRPAAAVIVLTALVCAVAASGDGPIRQRPDPYVPSRTELIEIGAVTSTFPVPGALPPEVFPPEAYGLGPPGPPEWLWWLLGAICAVAVVYVGARIVRELLAVRWHLPRLGWRRRPRVATVQESPPAAESARTVNDEESEVARAAVDAALAPLSEPADPRAAVIEAYVRMEHVLAERALARRSPEAPREYLRRVLGEQGMPQESLATLTALFEEARFSRHPIPESAPRRAATELEAARVALAVPSAPASA